MELPVSVLPIQYSLPVARSGVSQTRSDRAAQFHDVAMLGESGRQSFSRTELRFTNHHYARVQSAHSR
jgi:hypothetical protein